MAKKGTKERDKTALLCSYYSSPNVEPGIVFFYFFFLISRIICSLRINHSAPSGMCSRGRMRNSHSDLN